MTKTNTNTNTQAQSPWLQATYKKLKTQTLTQYQKDQANLLLTQITINKNKLSELKQELTQTKETIQAIKSSNIKSKETIITDYTNKYNTSATQYNQTLTAYTQAKGQYQEIINAQDSAISLNNLFYAISHDNFIPEKYLEKWNNLPQQYLTQTNTSKEGKTYYTINIKDTILTQYGNTQLVPDTEITLTNLYQEITQTNEYYNKDRWTSLKPELKKAFTQTVIHYAEQIITDLQKFITQEQAYDDAEPTTPASTNLDQRTTQERLSDMESEIHEIFNTID